jgi:hypothetical protein
MLEPATRPFPVVVAQPAEPEEIFRESPLGGEGLELGIDLAGPMVGGPAGDRPARLHVELGPAQACRLLGASGEVGGDPVRWNSVEVAGLSFAGDRRERAAWAGDLPEQPPPPRGDGAERVVRAVQEPRAHDERVPDDDVDKLRARTVRGLGDRDEQLPVLGLALDEQRVALVDAERRADDRVGIASQRLGWKQRFARHHSIS